MFPDIAIQAECKIMKNFKVIVILNICCLFINIAVNVDSKLRNVVRFTGILLYVLTCSG